MESFLEEFDNTEEAYFSPLPRSLHQILQESIKKDLGLPYVGSSLFEIIQQCGEYANKHTPSTQKLFGQENWKFDIFERGISDFPRGHSIHDSRPRFVFYPIPGESSLPIELLGITMLFSYCPLTFSTKSYRTYGIDNVGPGTIAWYDFLHEGAASAQLFPLSESPELPAFYKKIIHGREGFTRLFYSHVWMMTAWGLLDFLRSNASELDKKKLLWGEFCWIRESTFRINPHQSFDQIFKELKKQYPPNWEPGNPDIRPNIEKIFGKKTSSRNILFYFFDKMVEYGCNWRNKEIFDTQHQEIWSAYKETLTKEFP